MNEFFDSQDPRTTDYAGKNLLTSLEQARNYNTHLADILRPMVDEASRVLDFGAGNGTFLELLKNDKTTFLAIEPDPILQRKIRSKGNAKIVSLEHLQEESVDFIYSLNVLEHIADDKAILNELRRVLRPGGALLIFVPAFPHLYSDFDFAIGHYRRYTRRDLASKVKDAGYEIESVFFLDSVGYLAALFYRLFVNESELSNKHLKRYDTWFYPVSRIIQPVTRRFFGKNLVMVARQSKR